eukprot:2766623-Amphidinium_carterae.1
MRGIVLVGALFAVKTLSLAGQSQHEVEVLVPAFTNFPRSVSSGRESQQAPIATAPPPWQDCLGSDLRTP